MLFIQNIEIIMTSANYSREKRRACSVVRKFIDLICRSRITKRNFFIPPVALSASFTLTPYVGPNANGNDHVHSPTFLKPLAANRFSYDFSIFDISLRCVDFISRSVQLTSNSRALNMADNH